MKVKIYTLGCKVNQYETQALLKQLKEHGFCPTDDIADIYIVNSCSVTHRADVKTKQAIASARAENPKAKVAVCGCLVQGGGKYLASLDADFFIKQEDKPYLAEIVSGENEFEPKKDIWSLEIDEFFNQRAFLKVQDGCNQFCTFCKIPYLRGRSRSRPLPEVIAEARRLASKHKEIILCGVNLGLYGQDFNDKLNLHHLLHALLKIKSVGRIRLSSLEPLLVTDEIIELLGHPKICPHLHLPFQSGDDYILGKMNKPESIKLYYDLVARLRKSNPDIAISCDIMVGFPAETNTSFLQTLNFIKDIRPMRMHVFSFSPRQHTVLADAQVKDNEKVKERSRCLRQLASSFALDYQKRFINKKLTIVAEKVKDGSIQGYSQNYIPLVARGNASVGSLSNVELLTTGNPAKGVVC